MLRLITRLQLLLAVTFAAHDEASFHLLHKVSDAAHSKDEAIPKNSYLYAFLTDDAKAAMTESFKTADSDGDHVVGLEDLQKISEISDDAESLLMKYGSLVKVGASDPEDPHNIGFSFEDYILYMYKGPVEQYQNIMRETPVGEFKIGKVIKWLQQKCEMSAPGSSHDYATDILTTTYGYRSAILEHRNFWNAESPEVMDIPTFEELYAKSEMVAVFHSLSSGGKGELTYDDFVKKFMAEGQADMPGLADWETFIGKTGRQIVGGLLGFKSDTAKRRAEVKDQMKMMGRKTGESGEKIVKFTAFINFLYDRNENLARSMMWGSSTSPPDYSEKKWYVGRSA